MSKTRVELTRVIGHAAVVSVALVLVCFFAHFRCSSRNELILRTGQAGTWFFTVAIRDNSVIVALATVFIADIIVFLAALVALHRRNCVDEELATLLVTGYLWFVVAGVAFAALTGRTPPVDAFKRDIAAKVLSLLPLVCVKEWLFRKLRHVYDETGRMLCFALAWHCRKDGLFNGFFLIAMVAGILGFSPTVVQWLLYFAKLWLLGNASLLLTKRLRAQQWPTLRREAADADAM